MQINLKKIFQPVAEVPSTDRVICDVYMTLIDRNGSLDSDLHNFLLWLKQQGTEVCIVSQTPVQAERDLKNAGCSEELLRNGVKDKMEIQSDLSENDRYVAIDDDVMIWLDAPAALLPSKPAFREYLGQARYKEFAAQTL